MRKLSLLLVIVLMFVFYSCSSETDNQISPDIQQVLSLTGEAQKQAYSLLSPEEKQNLWQSKLDLLLSKSILFGRKVELSDQKRALIIELTAIISRDFFDISVPSYDSKHTDFVKPWYKKAKQVFKKHEFIEIFSAISKNGYLEAQDDELDLDGNPTGTKCECNQFEDYCWFSDCINLTCEYRYTSCGTLWGSPCDGMCN